MQHLLRNRPVWSSVSAYVWVAMRTPGAGQVARTVQIAACAGDEPVQDARSFFGDQGVGEVVDLPVVCDDPVERDQPHRAPERAAGADFRALVAEQPQCVSGGETEEVLSHPAGLDPVSAGQYLDAGLVEAVTGLGFGADDNAPAMQLGEIGGVHDARPGHQETGRGGIRVIPEKSDDDVQENTFAAFSLPIEEWHDLRADITGDRVAQQLVQKVDHLTAFGVVAERVGEELLPARCSHRPGLDARGMRVAMPLRIRRGDQTGVEVDHPSGVHSA